jgi:hypothetical protein
MYVCMYGAHTRKHMVFTVSRAFRHAHNRQQYTHTGEWTHVVWTITRSAPTATTATHRAYINGVLKLTAYGNLARELCTANYVAKSNFPDPGYVGSIDSLAVYPWVLGPSEVTAVFESTGALVCMRVQWA